jgi:hypothetical protein
VKTFEITSGETHYSYPCRLRVCKRREPMDKLLTPQVKAMAASWGRSFLAAVIALYTAGETDPIVLVHAGIAAVVPVVIRFINTKDAAFGRVAGVVLEEALKKTAPKKKK